LRLLTGLQNDVVFPEPEDLCQRILKVHELHNQRGWYLSRNYLSTDLIILLTGIVQIVRKDNPSRRTSIMNVDYKHSSDADFVLVGPSKGQGKRKSLKRQQYFTAN